MFGFFFFFFQIPSTCSIKGETTSCATNPQTAEAPAAAALCSPCQLTGEAGEQSRHPPKAQPGLSSRGSRPSSRRCSDPRGAAGGTERDTGGPREPTAPAASGGRGYVCGCVSAPPHAGTERGHTTEPVRAHQAPPPPLPPLPSASAARREAAGTFGLAVGAVLVLLLHQQAGQHRLVPVHVANRLARHGAAGAARPRVTAPPPPRALRRFLLPAGGWGGGATKEGRSQ